ncbi:MAG: hypothetical protein Q8L65_09125 [Burkholderiales bacterium]|nr:hypothetical protein [Burkholderiales bacterium]MDP2398574.1 hypothetical protein [Burkholderiales bacterium]
MEFPTLRKCFANLFRLIPGANAASFVGGKTGTPAPTPPSAAQDASPFVLVASRAGGQWDVYAGDFEHPLASFEERQAGCDFASDLAKNRKDSIVLIRELPGR